MIILVNLLLSFPSEFHDLSLRVLQAAKHTTSQTGAHTLENSQKKPLDKFLPKTNCSIGKD